MEQYTFTEKGREHLSLEGSPWVDLSRKDFLDEVGMLFVLWVGHNVSTEGTENELVEQNLDLLTEFFDYMKNQ